MTRRRLLRGATSSSSSRYQPINGARATVNSQGSGPGALPSTLGRVEAWSSFVVGIADAATWGMRPVTLIPAVLTMACAGPQRIERQEPRSYRERIAEADQHERDAAVHARAASEARGTIDVGQVQCGHPAVGAAADQTTSGGERVSSWVPCWSVERDAARFHQAEADRLRREAQVDRAVARNLLAVETEFCRAMTADELTHTPFSHREDIAAVESYVEGGTLKGARIHFKAVRGLDAEWMRQALLCHRARAAMIGYDPKYMDYDPTMLDAVNVVVTEHMGTVHVLVRSDSVETSAVVQARARALLEPVGGESTKRANTAP